MAQSLPKEQFKEEVDRYLSRESSEIIYFKLYKSQMPVIEQALEMASRLLGSDKPRGYCLELICADFLLAPVWITIPTPYWSPSLAGAALARATEAGVLAPPRTLAEGERRMTSRRAGPQVRSDPALLRLKIMERDNWRCQFCGARSNLQVPTSSIAARVAPTRRTI